MRDVIASVGIRNGVQTRNRIDDQQTVIDLLEQVPQDAGGAAGVDLDWLPLAAGVCQEDLHQAIRFFQHTNVDKVRFVDGHVDPGQLTIQWLNRLAQPAPERGGESGVQVIAEEERYREVRSRYTGQAKIRAGIDQMGAVVPEDGFRANRQRMVAVYEYYRTLYRERPSLFLWAGLGYLAGAAVVGGFDAPPINADPQLQTVMVRIGRDIFDDLAWLHEVYLSAPHKVREYAGWHDRHNQYARYGAGGTLDYVHRAPVRSYQTAWEKIINGDPAGGNHDLLMNEQWSIIQPHYERLRHLPGAGLVTPMVDIIHPYHRPFIIDLPGGDILDAATRWSWITRDSYGMWNNWLAAGQAERTRLVSIDFASLCRKHFGFPGRPDLLFPGASTSESW